jgi:hypothetical protein
MVLLYLRKLESRWEHKKKIRRMRTLGEGGKAQINPHKSDLKVERKKMGCEGEGMELPSDIPGGDVETCTGECDFIT